jgi:hypothetical protein
MLVIASAEKAKAIIAVQPEAVSLFGANAAALLAQIDYWHRKANNGVNRRIVGKHGYRWVALSREEWMQQTGLSLKRFNTAIRKLRDAGVIAAKKTLRDGRTVALYRLLIDYPVMPNGEQPGSAQKGTTGSAQTGTTLILIETGSSKTEKTLVAAIASTGSDHSVLPEKETPFPPAPLPSTIEETKEGIEMAKASNVADVLAGITGHTKKEIKPVDAKTSTELATVFRTAWAETQTGFLPTFGAKHLGQLNQIRLKVPQSCAGLIVDSVVRNWDLFVATAKQEQAAFNAPTSPDLGFMLRFAQSMVATWKELQTTSTKTATKPVLKPVQAKPAAPAPKPPVAPDDQMMSLEDVSKALFGE